MRTAAERWRLPVPERAPVAAMPTKRVDGPPTMRGTASPEVAAVFDLCPAEVRKRLLELRQLIFETAAATDGVGTIEETLKWGEPSYLTVGPKSGTTIRIDRHKSGDGRYALFVPCSTNLIETFRERYGARLTFEGNRAVVLDAADPLPTDELRHCIALALTYHVRKRQKRAG